MYCDDCGYALSAFDLDCPRCKRLKEKHKRDLELQQEAQSNSKIYDTQEKIIVEEKIEGAEEDTIFSEEYRQNKKVGEDAKSLSWTLGILGLFFFPIIMGIFALHYAHKAERYGASAINCRSLAALDIILGVIGLAAGIAYICSQTSSYMY